jgi:hypothetical protein
LPLPENMVGYVAGRHLRPFAADAESAERKRPAIPCKELPVFRMENYFPIRFSTAVHIVRTPVRMLGSTIG